MRSSIASIVESATASNPRTLRLEQLEGRLMLSANPGFFFTHDHVRMDASDDFTPQQISGGRNSEFQVQRGRSVAQRDDVEPRSTGHFDGLREQSRSNSHQNRWQFGQSDRGPRDVQRFEIVVPQFSVPAQSLSSRNAATSLESLTSARPADVVGSSSTVFLQFTFSPNNSSSRIGVGNIGGPQSNRSQTHQPAQAASKPAVETGGSTKPVAGDVDTNNSSLVSTTAQQTLTSIILRNDRIVAPSRSGLVSQSHLWRLTTPPVYDDVAMGEIGRWLDHSESVQDKFNDLDRTLQELAEEQSQTVDPLKHNSSLSPRKASPRRESDPGRTDPAFAQPNDWLSESNGLLLAPAANVSNNMVSQAELDSKLADAANAGWTIGIGVYQSFETSESNLMLTSAVRTVEVASSRLKPQDEDASDVARTPKVSSTAAATAFFAVALSRVWYIRERRRLDLTDPLSTL